MGYSDFEYELFSRQFILKDFSEDKISKLSSLNFTVVGAGGIGCPLSIYLISSGVKNLTLIDNDIIEKTNLNRQILFNIEDLGKKKVDIAKYKLKKINPEINLKTLDTHINHNNLSILEKPSIIIDTTDDWENSKTINEYCVKNSIIFLFSSAIGYDVQIGLFQNNKLKHSCLNCLFPNKQDVELPRCETVGISGIAAGIAGLMTAQRAVNCLLNHENNFDTLTLFNVKNEVLQKIKVKENNQCTLNNFLSNN